MAKNCPLLKHYKMKDIQMTNSITTEEAQTAINMPCTLDDILDAEDGILDTDTKVAIAQYLKAKNEGVLFVYGQEVYVHWINSVGIKKIERIFWCEKGEETLFRRSVEGTVDFLHERSNPGDFFSNWDDFPQLHEYGMIAFCPDGFPQDINWFVDIAYTGNADMKHW
jgi:hypothetical protein